MKNFFLVFSGVLIGLLLAYGLCESCLLTIDCCNPPPPYIIDIEDPDGGDTIEYKNVATFRNNYKTQFLDSTQTNVYGCMGGRISIANMVKLISGARTGNEYINFRIGYDSTTTVLPNGNTFNSKIFTMFSLGNMQTQTSNYPVYMNTGQSYCPTQCDAAD